MDKWWHGEVHFCLEGAGLNGLLRSAAAAGLCLRAVRRESRMRMTGRASWKDSHALQRLAEGQGIRMTRLHALGAPWLWLKLKQRWGLPLGGALCLAALLWHSCHLQAVSYTGLPAQDPARLQAEQVLAEAGFVPGAFLDHDAHHLRDLLRHRIPELSFAEVVLRGNRAEVLLTRAIAPPESATGAERGLFAAASGVITQVDVHSGTACVAVGDAVAAGDMLIAPQAGSAEQMRAVPARGSVQAQVFVCGEATLALPEAVDTGRVCRRYALQIGAWMLPEPKPRENWPVFRMKTVIHRTFSLKSLDIHLIERLYYEQNPALGTWDQVAQAAVQQATRKAMRLLPSDAVILSRESRWAVQGNELTAVTVLSILADIAKGEPSNE